MCLSPASFKFAEFLIVFEVSDLFTVLMKFYLHLFTMDCAAQTMSNSVFIRRLYYKTTTVLVGRLEESHYTMHLIILAVLLTIPVYKFAHPDKFNVFVSPKVIHSYFGIEHWLEVIRVASTAFVLDLAPVTFEQVHTHTALLLPEGMLLAAPFTFIRRLVQHVDHLHDARRTLRDSQISNLRPVLESNQLSWLLADLQVRNTVLEAARFHSQVI